MAHVTRNPTKKVSNVHCETSVVENGVARKKMPMTSKNKSKKSSTTSSVEVNFAGLRQKNAN
jgi:hypothetical protein